MSHWSAENATRAYLRTIKMGKRGKEPDVAEFISALAGGNNAQLMVEVCGSIAGPTTLALVAAAQQTGGRVACILPGLKEVQKSKSELSSYLDRVELVTGDLHTLLTNDYKGADFVIIDCNINNQDMIFKAVPKGGAQVLGYNAQHIVPSWNELGGHFLPIGEGLLVTKVPKTPSVTGYGNGPTEKRSKWIKKVDKCTGEEHVYRVVTCPQQRVIQA